mmetsp:Transcript_15352/g.36521  ORF Transcript_15352/g.36521 Transcript_15352/m.36521 type:complete len:272 (+) Transcript_15352:746-1561(+)
MRTGLVISVVDAVLDVSFGLFSRFLGVAHTILPAFFIFILICTIAVLSNTAGFSCRCSWCSVACAASTRLFASAASVFFIQALLVIAAVVLLKLLLGLLAAVSWNIRLCSSLPVPAIACPVWQLDSPRGKHTTYPGHVAVVVCRVGDAAVRSIDLQVAAIFRVVEVCHADWPCCTVKATASAAGPKRPGLALLKVLPVARLRVAQRKIHPALVSLAAWIPLRALERRHGGLVVSGVGAGLNHVTRASLGFRAFRLHSGDRVCAVGVGLTLF